MRLWMSAEVDASVYEAYRQARPIVEGTYNALFDDADYGAGIQKWAFLPIILPPSAGAAYPEVQRHDRRRGVLEFRLKVDYDGFRAGTPDDQVRLLVDALLRSLKLLPGMEIAGLNAAQMERAFRSLANAQGWTRARASVRSDG